MLISWYVDLSCLFHHSPNAGCAYCFEVVFFFFNLKKYSERANLMLTILNKVVTNLGTRCQAHATVRADLGLFLLCLTEVKDRFDYFRPWVGEDLCHPVHTRKGQAGKGRGTAAQPGPRPVRRVPVTFPGTAPTSGPIGRSPQMP